MHYWLFSRFFQGMQVSKLSNTFPLKLGPDLSQETTHCSRRTGMADGHPQHPPTTRKRTAFSMGNRWLMMNSWCVNGWSIVVSQWLINCQSMVKSNSFIPSILWGTMQTLCSVLDGVLSQFLLLNCHHCLWLSGWFSVSRAHGLMDCIWPWILYWHQLAIINHYKPPLLIIINRY